MSTYYSKTVQFNCGDDHSLTEPCEGHALRIRYHATSDTVTIEVDGEDRYTMGDGEFSALLKAAEDEENKLLP